MPYPCSDYNLMPDLVTDYIQKRRGEPGLFSFEYNLLSKLISDLYHYMDQAIVSDSVYCIKIICTSYSSKKIQSKLCAVFWA